MKRWQAAVALAVLLGGCRGRGLPHEGQPVAQLQAMPDAPSPAVQAQGAPGLRRHGKHGAPAVPCRAELLSSPDPVVRQQAALALGKVGPDARAAVPSLTRALSDPQWAVRRQAALALGEVGPDAVTALKD